METVGALGVILEGVEPDFFDGSVSCEYGSIILLLQIVWCLRNIPMKVSLRGSNNGTIDPQCVSLHSPLTVKRAESDNKTTSVHGVPHHLQNLRFELRSCPCRLSVNGGSHILSLYYVLTSRTRRKSPEYHTSLLEVGDPPIDLWSRGVLMLDETLRCVVQDWFVAKGSSTNYD